MEWCMAREQATSIGAYKTIQSSYLIACLSGTVLLRLNWIPRKLLP